jgi:hypothetical protein
MAISYLKTPIHKARKLRPIEDFLCGSFAGIITTLVGHPFDTVKVCVLLLFLSVLRDLSRRHRLKHTCQSCIVVIPVLCEGPGAHANELVKLHATRGCGRVSRDPTTRGDGWLAGQVRYVAGHQTRRTLSRCDVTLILLRQPAALCFENIGAEKISSRHLLFFLFLQHNYC